MLYAWCFDIIHRKMVEASKLTYLSSNTLTMFCCEHIYGPLSVIFKYIIVSWSRVTMLHTRYPGLTHSNWNSVPFDTQHQVSWMLTLTLTPSISFTSVTLASFRFCILRSYRRFSLPCLFHLASHPPICHPANYRLSFIYFFFLLG